MVDLGRHAPIKYLAILMSEAEIKAIPKAVGCQSVSASLGFFFFFPSIPPQLHLLYLGHSHNTRLTFSIFYIMNCTVLYSTVLPTKVQMSSQATLPLHNRYEALCRPHS